MGKALLGRKLDERFYVQVNERYGYYAVVESIEQGAGRRLRAAEGF